IAHGKARTMNMTAMTMKGNGFYNANSQIQLGVIKQALPLICQAAELIPLPANNAPLVIADYGCAEGGNSIAALKPVVEVVQRRNPGQQIIVIHNDQPANNFNHLFST